MYLVGLIKVWAGPFSRCRAGQTQFLGKFPLSLISFLFFLFLDYIVIMEMTQIKKKG
jgi:hypothetical protein